MTRWLDGLEERARQTVPPHILEYVRQGAGASLTTSEATASWADVRLAPRVLRDVTRVDLTTWQPGPPPDHVVQEVPAGAVIVDVREPNEGPEAAPVHLPYSRLSEWGPGLDPARTYLFVCSGGTRSEMVAHELRRRGLKAFSLAGGVSSLRTPAA